MNQYRWEISEDLHNVNHAGSFPKPNQTDTDVWSYYKIIFTDETNLGPVLDSFIHHNLLPQ